MSVASTNVPVRTTTPLAFELPRDHVNPAFATGGPESFKGLILQRSAGQGRHHKEAGHTAPGTSPEVILGGGCAGKRIFSCRSRSA